ncbi:hypothetical protein ASE13_10430 [Sphingomonas sp. Root241]|nr:hypothetical protein ASE13_10430 [Sphingomonas sp. Root241]
MLDDVERRSLLVEPAREDPAPALVELLHVDLHEGAGELVGFPGRGLVAGAQSHDDVVDPRRLAGLELEFARDAVALVEQAEHCLALVHRRGRGIQHAGIGSDRHDFRAARGVARPGGDDQVLGAVVARLLAALARAKAEQQQHRCRRSCGAISHASGVQAS